MTGDILIARLDARDRELFLRWCIFGDDHPWVRRFWKTLTHLGGVLCSIALATIPLRSEGAIGTAAHRATTILVVSHLIVQLIKRTVGRPRPSRTLTREALVAEPDRFSFPSGHSAAAMSVAIAYAATFPSLAIIFVPLALLVGASRVFLGVHYPGDVVIGQLIALLTGLPILLG